MTSRYETELVNALDRLGFAVMRSPSSGSRTERNQPDILALKGDAPAKWAIEHKYTSDPHAYYDADEVDQLREFADRAGACAMLGARFNSRGKSGRVHYLVPPGAADRTAAGNFRVSAETAGDRAEVEVDAADTSIRLVVGDDA